MGSSAGEWTLRSPTPIGFMPILVVIYVDAPNIGAESLH